MTVADLIENLLRAIHREFYADRPQEFFRDRRNLTRAIARYGVECNSRHWQFGVDAIRADLLAILRSMQDKKADIAYLPVYLEGAVDRHIRLRAEELSAQAKKLEVVVGKTIGMIQPAAVRAATPVETLAVLYRDLKRARRPGRRATVAGAKQKELL